MKYLQILNPLLPHIKLAKVAERQSYGHLSLYSIQNPAANTSLPAFGGLASNLPHDGEDFKGWGAQIKLILSHSELKNT